MTAESHSGAPKSATLRPRRNRNVLPYVADSILLEESGMPWLVRSSIIAATIIVLISR